MDYRTTYYTGDNDTVKFEIKLLQLVAQNDSIKHNYFSICKKYSNNDKLELNRLNVQSVKSGITQLLCQWRRV